MKTCKYPEAHEAHMALNGECPWCGAAAKLARSAALNRDELVEAVKAHALAHYEDGGWDVIVECWTDEMIAEVLAEKPRLYTAKGAIKMFAPLVGVWADRQADARISAGQEPGPTTGSRSARTAASGWSARCAPTPRPPPAAGGRS